MRPRRHGIAAVAAALALAAGFPPAGCGDDDEETTVPTLPTTTATEPPQSEDEGGKGEDEGGEKSDSGGTPGPGGSGEYDPERDVEGHDIPPPPGSPAEQAEQTCLENPGAC